MESVKSALDGYLERATSAIEQIEGGNSKPHPFADILRMGRGIITQQDAEIRHLKNELSVKTETIRTILSTRKEPA
jgi:hypothetical protein